MTGPFIVDRTLIFPTSLPPQPDHRDMCKYRIVQETDPQIDHHELDDQPGRNKIRALCHQGSAYSNLLPRPIEQRPRCDCHQDQSEGHSSPHPVGIHPRQPLAETNKQAGHGNLSDDPLPCHSTSFSIPPPIGPFTTPSVTARIKATDTATIQTGRMPRMKLTPTNPREQKA